MSLAGTDPFPVLKEWGPLAKTRITSLAAINHSMTCLTGAGLTFAAIVMSLHVGCAQKPETSVSGKVTYQGQPVPHGEIAFFKPATGEVAQGALGDGGAYSLVTADKELSPGEYLVVIAPTRIYEKATGPHGMEYKMVEKGGESIPVRYRDRVNSPLKATLAPGTNTVDFELVK